MQRGGAGLTQIQQFATQTPRQEAAQGAPARVHVHDEQLYTELLY